MMSYRQYFNESRGHHGIGITPVKKSSNKTAAVISLKEYRWKKNCGGLYQLPTAA
jgi:hypothetical protein